MQMVHANYPELSVRKLLEVFGKDQSFMDYLPDKCTEVRRWPRKEYLWGFIWTLRGEKA
jgi:hypothetical protein